ncbi:MAG: hypothetical protein AAFQ02_05100 [Bacteroidota bacterium]
MQRILLSSLFFLITLTITAQQEQTLFNSGRGISLTGFWAGGNSSLYDFQDNKTLSNGGYATFEFNNNFLIGWSGYKSDITNQGQEIDIDGNDVLLGYAFQSKRVVHPILYTQFGSSRLEVEDLGSDRVFVVQPSLGLEVNVTRFFRLGVDGGYRFFSGNDLPGFSDADFSGPTLGLRLKFGWSWGGNDWGDSWDDF